MFIWKSYKFFIVLYIANFGSFDNGGVSYPIYLYPLLIDIKSLVKTLTYWEQNIFLQEYPQTILLYLLSNRCGTSWTTKKINRIWLTPWTTLHPWTTTCSSGRWYGNTNKFQMIKEQVALLIVLNKFSVTACVSLSTTVAYKFMVVNVCKLYQYKLDFTTTYCHLRSLEL